MSVFNFEIIEKVGVLSETSGGTKEINIVSWNGGKPVYEIRRWNNDRRPLRGITLTREEAAEAVRMLSDRLQSEA